MHQHAFSRQESGGVAEQEQSGREHERGRRRDGQGELAGHRHHELGSRSRHGGQAAARGERGDLLAGASSVTPGPVSRTVPDTSRPGAYGQALA
jgi:hypothetical protein